MFRFLSVFRNHLLISILLLLMLVVGGGLVVIHAQTPSVKAPSCGTLTLHNGGQNPYVLSQNARSIEQCFVLAYRSCQEKALDVTWMGVDTGTTSTFTIEKQDKSCQISQSSQNYGLVHTNSQSEVGICQGLTQSTDSLILKRCGSGGDILIPRSELCGYVYSQQTVAAVGQAETCFMQDYRQCYGAALGYEPSGSFAYTFQFDFSCKLTVVVSSTQARYACAGLVQQTDGLRAQNCGTEGTILIPAHP